jgi:hypothetical protein
MKFSKSKVTNTLGWLIVSILLVSGLVFCVDAVRNFNDASIIIEWSTASELDTVGFNLLRAENPEEEKIKINKQTIPSSPDPHTGGDYRFIDDDVENGKTYLYWLENINSDGSTDLNGPIIQAAKNAALNNLAIGGLLIFSAVGIYLWYLRDTIKAEEIENGSV